MRIKGWDKVLKFTYIQTIKGKSFIVSMVVMVAIFSLMIAGVNFLPQLLDSDEPEIISGFDEDGNPVEIEAFKVKKVYIYDNSGLNIDFSFLSAIELENESVTEEKVQSVMDSVTASGEAEILAVIKQSEGGYGVAVSRPESTELIGDSDCYAVLNLFDKIIRDANLINLGVAPEDIGKSEINILSTVSVGGEEPENPTVKFISSVVTMATSLILFVIIISFGQLTAQAIATEKASRVMELLLTSVKPLAVIVGKVLATTLVALTSVAAVGGIVTGVFFLIAPFGTIGEIIGSVETTEPFIQDISSQLSSAFSGFTPTNIVLILIVFVLGFLFYALISGLIGSSISKIEDLQSALQPLIYISMLGFYLTYFSSMTGFDPQSPSSGGNWLVTLSRFLPISSPFALPGAIISGAMSGAEIAVAIGFLALCLVLFALFVAKIYEHIILHTGDRVKIKDMIKLAKNKN